MKSWINIRSGVKAAISNYPTSSPLHHSHVLSLTLLFALLLGIRPVFSETTTSTTDCTTSFSHCFIPGEISEYKVSWMKLPLAWSKSTTETFYRNDQRLIRLTMIAKSYATYAAVYKVDNRTEVIIDPERGLPLSLDIIQNEGSRHNSSLTTFDHQNKNAVYIDRMNQTTNSVDISENTRDIFTFLYTSRSKELKQLTQETHNIYVNGKMYDLDLKIRTTQKCKIADYGKTECVQLEPIAEFDGLFIREGRIFFWVSETDHRMITLAEAKVPVGKIKVKLESVNGVSDPFWKNKD